MNAVTSQLQELRVRNPALFRSVLVFNYCPAVYLHPSRRAQIFNGSIPELSWEEPAATTRLSALLLTEFELSKHPYLIVPDPHWSLALLSRERLARLAAHVGAVIFAPQIRTCLARSNVLEWKERLGVDAFQFIMQSSLLLPPLIEQPPILPDADSHSLGFGLILQCLSASPFEMQQRVLLKTPVGAQASSVSHRAASQIVFSVMNILEGEWHSFCNAIRH